MITEGRCSIGSWFAKICICWRGMFGAMLCESLVKEVGFRVLFFGRELKMQKIWIKTIFNVDDCCDVGCGIGIKSWELSSVIHVNNSVGNDFAYLLEVE
uniref:Uncharacterized protein n=1 Tax=Ralstonia syzygii R24 TaxID=907261 RepID=G3A3F2_9RALS|nr:hypothetical protein RALSY_30132 [Ralstonia syzygii R24]